MANHEHQQHKIDLTQDLRATEGRPVTDWVSPYGEAMVREFEPDTDPYREPLSPMMLNRRIAEVLSVMSDKTGVDVGEVDCGAVIIGPDSPESRVFIPGRKRGVFTEVMVTGTPEYGYTAQIDPNDPSFSGNEQLILSDTAQVVLVARERLDSLEGHPDGAFDKNAVKRFEAAVIAAQQWAEQNRHADKAVSRLQKIGRFFLR